MSETQSRPSAPRGRGSHRGGRGGFRGGRGTGKSTKAEVEDSPPQNEENREILELKKKHGSKVSTVREMFPSWTDEDIVYALEDAGGDLEVTVERITSGSIGQWGEVSKKADRSRSKLKDTQPNSHEGSSGTRGSRGRGGLEGRARGRGTDRGRGSRGARGTSQTNGTRASDRPAKPAQDSWDKPVQDSWGETTADTTEGVDSWADAATNGDNAATDTAGKVDSWSDPKPKPVESKPTVIPSHKVSNWAGLFAKPPPEPAPKKAPTPPPIAAVQTPPPVDDSVSSIPIQDPTTESSHDVVSNDGLKATPSEPVVDITPSKDELTHDNLEHIPDVSQPIASATAASTVASTLDASQNPNNVQAHIRPGMSGYAASALKATTSSGRASSFQRRVLEQQEAVVMPENHAVSKAAMQFGSMNIGEGEDGGPDEDREDPETRTQLLDDSPVAPRASLPPAAPPAIVAPVEPPTAPKAAPGLPPAPQQPASASPSQATSYADQFSRYGQAPQKAYDAFGQPSAQQQHAQPAAPPSQENHTSQAPSQSQATPATGPGDYGYYGQDAQRAYQNFYGYNQNQDVQQRSGSAFGTLAESQSQYATSRPQAGAGAQDAQNSGHNTPNPVPSGQHPQQQQQPQSMHQGQASYGGYPYGYANAGYNQPYPQYASYMNQMSQHQYGQNRPMFDDVRRGDESHMSYNNQYGSYGGRQYAGNHYNKSAMYGQPQQQYSSYEHSSSPAQTGALSQTSAGREAAYGRTGSAQPSESQQTGATSAFGSMDPFSREQSNYGSHTPMSQQQGGQMGLDDHGKSYDAGKGGPSPQMKNAHRPASAANMQGHQQGGSQQPSSFPPPQTGNQQHAGFGNYPQYAGFGGNVGGAHHNQQHQQGPGAAAQGNHPSQNAQQQQQYGYGSGAGGFGSYGAGGYGAGRGWASTYGGSH